MTLEREAEFYAREQTIFIHTRLDHSLLGACTHRLYGDAADESDDFVAVTSIRPTSDHEPGPGANRIRIAGHRVGRDAAPFSHCRCIARATD
jgi:hypothetical protein